LVHQSNRFSGQVPKGQNFADNTVLEVGVREGYFANLAEKLSHCSSEMFGRAVLPLDEVAQLVWNDGIVLDLWI
jgi:hypothetical protein